MESWYRWMLEREPKRGRDGKTKGRALIPVWDRARGQRVPFPRLSVREYFPRS